MAKKPTRNDPNDGLRAAWEDFRAALNGLAATDRERARLYLENATPSLRMWARAIQRERERA